MQFRANCGDIPIANLTEEGQSMLSQCHLGRECQIAQIYAIGKSEQHGQSAYMQFCSVCK